MLLRAYFSIMYCINGKTDRHQGAQNEKNCYQYFVSQLACVSKANDRASLRYKFRECVSYAEHSTPGIGSEPQATALHTHTHTQASRTIPIAHFHCGRLLPLTMILWRKHTIHNIHLPAIYINSPASTWPSIYTHQLFCYGHTHSHRICYMHEC